MKLTMTEAKIFEMIAFVGTILAIGAYYLDWASIEMGGITYYYTGDRFRTFESGDIGDLGPMIIHLLSIASFMGMIIAMLRTEYAKISSLVAVVISVIITVVLYMTRNSSIYDMFSVEMGYYVATAGVVLSLVFGVLRILPNFEKIVLKE